MKMKTKVILIVIVVLALAISVFTIITMTTMAMGRPVESADSPAQAEDMQTLGNVYDYWCENWEDIRHEPLPIYYYRVE